MNTVYQGEHLLPGQLGQFFIILAFTSALFSTISYFFASSDQEKFNNTWGWMGRIGHFINTISVIGTGACLFYIVYHSYFEYNYAWQHSSRKLPVYYIVSSFWDGQEGSFWLWTFWQAVLGNIMIWKAKSWERPVMTVIALAQTLLTSFLLGIEVFGAHIGSSPFILLRTAMADAPIFSRPDYLSFIKDGQGLNPLLQNYWMIIHPPILFLGFGSMVVPFAYCVAGLWKKRYKEWVQPAISYGLFAVMVLGTGVVMGSMWAYESLNFGGFWAWDPVENAAFIPWLTLVGAVHVLIVYKNTGHAYFTSVFLTLISFVLVLYASFLTRSGVLGDTSVHSFTDLGMYEHLVTDVLVFFVIAIAVVVWRWKELPISKKEEDTYSREFWMFVGAVFLGLSCLQLIVVTSIPVWNRIFGTHIAPPNNPVTLYNVFQAGFAVIITLLAGVTQFMKYKKTDSTRFFISSGIYLVVSVIITAVLVYLTGLYKLRFVFSLTMLGCVYTLLANSKILGEAFKGKIKLAGSAVAHIGFGLILVGALIAAGTSKVISQNTTTEYSEEFNKANNPRENIMLYKNEPVKMGDYTVTYIGDSSSSPNHYFKVDYKRFDAAGKLAEEFVLKPNSQANPKMGLVSSPDTKHYLFHDLYTHISMAPEQAFNFGDDEAAGHGESNDSLNYNPPVSHKVHVGDTIPFREGVIVLQGLNKQAHVQNIPMGPNDIAVGAELKVISHGQTYTAEPIFLVKDNNAYRFDRKVDDAGLKLAFNNIDPAKNEFEILVYEQPESKKPYIVMRAIEFPYINFLWSGTVIMVIGFLLSIFRRNKELKTI
jgi:cytochrome c-type biogenesis protein CcmF